MSSTRDQTFTLGQRICLLQASRAKSVWDGRGYSATVEAGTEGVITARELLDQEGRLTTPSIQEIRGYPSTPGYEVACIVPRQGYLSDFRKGYMGDDLEEVWVYVTPDVLTEVEEDRPIPHEPEVEQRLRQIEMEES